MIRLNGVQIRDLLEFVNPDKNDKDQMETEVDIEYKTAECAPIDDDGNRSPAGYYVRLTEYSEEGWYGPLGETTFAENIAKAKMVADNKLSPF